MANIWSFLVAHATVAALVTMWLFSNIVTALPSPSNTSGTGYKFLFALLHGLSGSLPRVFPSARVFNDPTQGSPTYFHNPNAGAGSGPGPSNGGSH